MPTLRLRRHNREPLSIGLVLSVLLLSNMLSGACASRTDDDAAAGARSAAAVPVTVATVVLKDVPEEIQAIGNVEAYSTVQIKTQVEGQLAQVHFQEGQWVKKGDLLFTIDPRPFEAALRQAQANLARDAAEAKNAEVDATRRRRLLDQGFVSQDEYDTAQTKAVASRAAVKADEAAVEDAKLQLQYCYIRSAIDGRAGQLLIHEGNVVKPNDTLLAVINQIRPIYVSFSVPERQLPDIRERAATNKLKVEAYIAHRTADPAIGELSFINNSVDTSTGTVLLKGLFPNRDERLWPGEFVDVNLTLATRPNALLVPSQAIQTGQEGQYVFVVSDDLQAEVRPVVTGDTIGSDTVVEKGLQAGERVVTDGQVRLAAGLKVQIKNAEETRAAGTS